MNSFSLRPRLLILLHKGRQLVSALEQPQEPASFCASEPLRPVAVTTQVLRSAEPLTLPDRVPAVASVLIDAAPLSRALDLQPNTDYVLPDINLCFYPSDQTVGLEPIPFDIEGARARTFSSGNLLKHLLTYWVTFLNCELEQYGWKVERQGTQLCLSAQTVRAGWNVSGTFSEYLQAFDSRKPLQGQSAGEAVHIHWGPYQMGEDICEVSFPFQSAWDLKTLQHTFETHLRRQYSGDLQWRDFYLELPTSVSAQALPYRSQLPGYIHQVLPLDLDAFQGAESIDFMLNGQQITLAPEATPQEWLNQLQSRATPMNIEVTLTQEQHLCLTARSVEQSLHLSQVSAGAHHRLGLEPVTILSGVASENQEDLWQEWLGLLEQFLPLLSEAKDIAEPLKQALQEAGSQQNTEARLAGLNALLPRIDQWMAAGEAQPRQLPQDMQTFQQVMQPVSLVQAGERGTPEGSSFDHKI